MWSPDGARIYVDSDGTKLVEVLLVDRSERVVANFFGREGRIGDIDTDGRFLYFSWVEEIGDIWVMDVVTEEE